MILMILYPLGVLAVFYLGMLFGAALIESDRKRTRRRPRLMQVAITDVEVVGEDEVVSFR